MARPPATYGKGRLRPIVPPRVAAHLQQQQGDAESPPSSELVWAETVWAPGSLPQSVWAPDVWEGMT